MAKNQINFSKMSKEVLSQLTTFKDSALAIATEDLRFKKELKPLRAKLECIIENRNNDIKSGIPVDEVIAKLPTTDVENAIRKAEVGHKAIVEPLNKAMRDTYAFIPEGMHDAYKRKIEEGKRGNFLNAIKDFLENLGIEGCSQAQISRFAEGMSDKLGAKYATSKKIVENNKFTSTMPKSQFSKLFIAVFCDTFVK